MSTTLKNRLLGDKLPSEKLQEEKFNVFWGLPVLASDAISSVAYAVDEILWAFVPFIGLASYLWLPRVAGAIILLLVVLITSYRQIVDAYPEGGGAYVVVKDNLKTVFGLIVGASLSVDYVLTVAVSISAGTAAITSAIPALFDHKVAISIMIIMIMTYGNLRGVKESAKTFGIPTYAFIILCFTLIVVGIFKYLQGDYTPINNTPLNNTLDQGVTFGMQAITVFILMKAFSSGCAAVTGVEAICDAIPNFKEPSQKNAKLAYVFLAIFVFITFGGISWLATIYHAVPDEHISVIAQLSTAIFGKGIMFYAIQFTTAVILAMAANTAYVGFPTLISVISRDGFAPRQLTLRGHRLNYSNGILLLALAAALLVIIFRGDTHLLIPLYAIGVFTSFTLAQAGMFVYWRRLKPKGWQYRAAINGIGFLVTLVTVIVIAVTKFLSGAWIVFIIIPLLVFGMLKIKGHYNSMAVQLHISRERIESFTLPDVDAKPYVIIPIHSLNKAVFKALRYARTISSNITVFHVETHEGEADKLRAKWQWMDIDIPLVIRQSPYREIIPLLVEYLESEQHESRPQDMITILLPQFIVKKPWEMALHTNTSLFITNALLKEKNIVVSILPFSIEEEKDNEAGEHRN